MGATDWSACCCCPAAAACASWPKHQPPTAHTDSSSMSDDEHDAGMGDEEESVATRARTPHCSRRTALGPASFARRRRSNAEVWNAVREWWMYRQRHARRCRCRPLASAAGVFAARTRPSGFLPTALRLIHSVRSRGNNGRTGQTRCAKRTARSVTRRRCTFASRNTVARRLVLQSRCSAVLSALPALFLRLPSAAERS